MFGNAFLLLKSENGIVANLHSTANQWSHKFLLEMTFENGYINLDGILSSTGSYAPEKLIYSYRKEEDIEKGMGRPLETSSTYEVDNSWKYELEEFLGAIRGEGKIKNVAGFDLKVEFPRNPDVVLQWNNNELPAETLKRLQEKLSIFL